AFLLTARAVGAAAAVLITGVVVGAYLLIGDFSLSAAVVLAALGAWYWRRCGRPLAHRSPRRAGFEVLAILAAYTAYEVARLHTEGTFEAAHANALRVVDFEQSLGLFFERSLQEPFLEIEPLLRSISFVYSYLFLAFVTAVALWL